MNTGVILIKHLRENLRLRENGSTELRKEQKITRLIDNGRLQIQVCISLRKLFASTNNQGNLFFCLRSMLYEYRIEPLAEAINFSKSKDGKQGS